MGGEAASLSKSAKSKQDWAAVFVKWREAILQLNGIPISSPDRNAARAKIQEYGQNLLYVEQQLINLTTPANFIAAIPCKPNFNNLRNFIYFCGNLGDYRGTEGEAFLTGEEDDIRVRRNRYGAITISGEYESWEVVLAPPRNRMLKKGTYDGAIGYSYRSSSSPSLRFSYDHKSCNKPTGKFTIHEILYKNGEVEFLDASIEQYCQEKNAKLFGHVRYYKSSSQSLHFMMGT